MCFIFAALHDFFRVFLIPKDLRPFNPQFCFSAEAAKGMPTSSAPNTKAVGPVRRFASYKPESAWSFFPPIHLKNMNVKLDHFRRVPSWRFFSPDPSWNIWTSKWVDIFPNFFSGWTFKNIFELLPPSDTLIAAPKKQVGSIRKWQPLQYTFEI